MIDFNEEQNRLNAEYKQSKKEFNRTPEGIKQNVRSSINIFVNKLIKERSYQIPFATVVLSIVLGGIWFVASHLISWYTVVIILINVVFIYWSKIISLKQYIHGKIKRKK